MGSPSRIFRRIVPGNKLPRSKLRGIHPKRLKDDRKPPRILSAMPEPCRQPVSIIGGHQALFTIQALTPLFPNISIV
jgi:hypothetical protein